MHRVINLIIGQAPVYYLLIEGLLLLWILWLLFRKSYKPDVEKLTEKEKEELINEWQPEPLVPPVQEDHYALKPMVINSKLGKYLEINDKKCVNLATHNYLGLVENEKCQQYALKALHKYGVGSCGPRGFYGTFDIHLELEERLAKFMNVEESVLYSYGFSAVASAIPAYAKKGDVIFCDEGVHLAIQKGLLASRSKIKFFKHNDVADLERLLNEQEKEDVKNPKKAKVTRRFMVVEGLYKNHGDICPLPEILELKKRHKVRLFLDEEVSFGVLGDTGRGVTEHFNIQRDEIDHISASLENSFGGYGGFGCGTTFIVDHQRLSGLGYCFSASLPPLQVAVALAALDILESDNDLIVMLRSNCEYIHKKLKNLEEIDVEGVDISPVKHIRYSKRTSDKAIETRRLESICEYAIKNKVALTVARYIESEEHNCTEPSIRLTVNALLSESEIDNAVNVIRDAFNKFAN